MSLVVRSIINASQIESLSTNDAFNLITDTVLDQIKKYYPDATKKDGLLIHYHPLADGSLSVKGEYYDD